MGRLSKKLVSIVAAVVVASTVMAQTPLSAIAADNSKDSNLEVQEEAKDVEASEASDVSVDDGVMLHAWNWSFNSIKDSLQEIKDAGYTTIQTSPAQACRLGKDWSNPEKGQTNDNPSWYYLYQPTYFTVGNAYLGTEDEFKAMCTEAHKLGLKIVVDVVANHLADCGNAPDGKVDMDLYNEATKCSGLTDPNRISNWSDRKQVTKGCCIGMPDINTSDGKKAQEIIGKYLANLVTDGADGFRFDAAKSIELPSEYETASNAVSSNFWPNVLKTAQNADTSKKLFTYGEVLQGDEPGTNAPGYIASNLMRITASNYGQILRYSVGYDVWQEEVDGKDVIRGEGSKSGKGEVRVKEPTVDENLLDTEVGGQWNYYHKNANEGNHYILPENKSVGFVETHDLYANAGATRAMTVAQREVCWAILTSRKDIVPLFFNRPVDTDFGTNMYHPKDTDAYKTMGERGSDDFKSKNVAVMNRFHTAMQSEDEKLEAVENTNNSVYKATRGEKGVLLANVTESEQKVETETCLPDNAKIYSSNDGSTLTVKDGKITGTLKPQSFVALSTVDLSGSGEITQAPTITVKNGATILINGSTTNITEKTSVTIELKNAEKASYKLGDADEVEIKDGKATVDITDTSDLVIKAQNGDKSSTATYKFTKASEVKYVNVTAQLNGKAVDNNSTTTIEKESKLNLAFENAESFAYKIDGKEVELTSEEIKNAIEDGIEITVGKDLEAGKTQKVEVTATNEKGSKTYIYTIKMKDPDAPADAAEITGKYNGSVITKTIEFTDKAQLDLSFKNAVSASYTIDKNDTVDVDKEKLDDVTSVNIGQNAKVGDTITVVVKAQNSDKKEESKTYTFKKVSGEKPPVDEFKFISATPDKTDITVGSDVTIICDATGDNVKYELYAKKENAEEEKYSGLQSSNKLTWTTKEAGNYVLRVVAKSGDKQDEKTINVTVKEEKKDFSVSLASDKYEIELGQTVKLTATPSNTSGTPKFKFKYKLSKNEWNSEEVFVVAKGYSESNTIDWKPNAVGTYNVVVFAQDDDHNGEGYITSKEITVKVTEKKNEDPKPGTTTTTTPGGQTPSGDAAKTLPIAAMMIASAAALVKKFKRQ